jgi:hypothetical protein
MRVLSPGKAQKIIERLTLEEDRSKVSLYLSKSVYEDFKKVCGSAPASRVMEELMKDFISNVQQTRKEKD